MTAAMGIGAVGGGLLVAARGPTGLAPLSGAAAAFGVVLILAALAPTLPLALVALVLVGWASVAFMATGNTTLQLAAAPEMRGRVMSLWFVAFQGSTPIGGPLVGWLMGWAGARVGLGRRRRGRAARRAHRDPRRRAPRLAPMRAATIRDGEDRRRRAPRSRARRGRGARPRPCRGPERRRHAAAPGRAIPPPPGVPADIPGLELAGEVAALGPGASALRGRRPRHGDRRRRRPGRARRRSTSASSCRSRTALDLAGGGRRCPRSSRPPTTRSSRRPGLRAGRAAARARRGRRRRHRGGAARPHAPARTSPRPSATRTHRDAVGRARRATRSSTRRASRSTARSTSCSSSSARRTSPANLKALATGGRIVVIGIGAGREGRAEPRARSWPSAGGSWRRRCARARWRRRPPPRGAGARASSRCCSAARCASRSPRRSRSTRPPTAYDRFAAGGKLGKIILEFEPSTSREPATSVTVLAATVRGNPR